MNNCGRYRDALVELTGRFLAAAETLRSSSFNFLSGRSTVYVLSPKYASPFGTSSGRFTSHGRQLQVAREFEDKWDKPHYLGAIDGKHVNVECPANFGSRDRKYKKSVQQVAARIERRQVQAKADNIGRIVSACVVLHNFLLKESPDSKAMYCPPGTTDTEDSNGKAA
ncbi:hypothetical protein HPB49_008553 [Dermacentor silvarum]|uniref:Uncharacterized protein n=1 Tax=Dermacentor silvarum TaxID=543639 RepID=A0ACB8CWD0_DERSI|nr:hypothetical protein HPB49_008553 [Dermacentor silvarum]